MVSAFLLSRYARLLHYDKEFFWNFAFVILVGGILGGRLFYSILNFDFFLDNPQEIFMLWHGGLVWYGGFFGGLISASVYLKLKKKPFFKTADMVVPFVALGHAIGRIGCFLNGCCYGRVASWGVYFPGAYPFAVTFCSWPVGYFCHFTALARQAASRWLHCGCLSFMRFFGTFHRGILPWGFSS